MIDLPGKPIIITGASSGIGAAAAIACARQGMPVALFARHEDKLNEIKERIECAGGRAIVVCGAVEDVDANHELIARTQEAFGEIYSVIANAGYGLEAECATVDLDAVRAIFEVNFYGSMNLVQPMVARFRQRGTGHAMMVSSGLSKIGLPYYGAYCATKAAQDHFCRAMRLELRGSGVHVSSVHPVLTKTGFHEAAARHSGGKLKISRSANMQTPERVADAIVRCLKKPKGEVWTSWVSRIGLGASVMMPGLTDWSLSKMVDKHRSAKDDPTS